MTGVRRQLATLLDYGGSFTRAKLQAFVADLEAYVRRGRVRRDRGRDAPLLLMDLTQCKQEVETDREAECVRWGVRLGLHLAVYDNLAIYRSVLAEHRAAGELTKRENLQRRNAAMAADYRRLKPEIGDLEARHKLSDEHDLTLKQVNTVLAAAGARKRKSRKWRSE